MQKIYKITSKMNGLALTMSDQENNSRFNRLIVAKFQGTMTQQWLIQKNDDTNYFIVNNYSHLVLDVQQQSYKIYAPILCYQKHGGGNQLWEIHQISDQQCYINNINSGYVLEIFGGIDAEGMTIVQNIYNCYKNQLWIIEQYNLYNQYY